ncbi:hypothetical protein PybrP1_011021 [[Pythium] brassicae (nom. inval.)]|nr:hypothetical protein PybrP1_011021 [[Pythium] brassicae (nom. inval.)]
MPLATAVHEVKSCAAALLLVSDAFALVPIKAVEVFLSDAHPPCAVSVEASGSPLLESKQSTARLALAADAPRNGRLVLEKEAAVGLPVNLQYHNVIVLAVSAPCADTICRVVQALQTRGAVEGVVSLVVLFVASDIIRAGRARFPSVKALPSTNLLETSSSSRTRFWK